MNKVIRVILAEDKIVYLAAAYLSFFSFLLDNF